jgi:hypothetical protein
MRDPNKRDPLREIIDNRDGMTRTGGVPKMDYTGGWGSGGSIPGGGRQGSPSAPPKPEYASCPHCSNAVAVAMSDQMRDRSERMTAKCDTCGEPFDWEWDHGDVLTCHHGSCPVCGDVHYVLQYRRTRCTRCGVAFSSSGGRQGAKASIWFQCPYECGVVFEQEEKKGNYWCECGRRFSAEIAGGKLNIRKDSFLAGVEPLVLNKEAARRHSGNNETKMWVALGLTILGGAFAYRDAKRKDAPTPSRKTGEDEGK